jgi:uncharacterized membrane protein YkoI
MKPARRDVSIAGAAISTAALATAAFLATASASYGAPHEPGAGIRPTALWAADQDTGSSSYTNADYSGVTSDTLSRAVEAIEKDTGGRVLEIRLLHTNPIAYAAVIAKGQELANVSVTPINPHVVALSAQETPQWMLDWQLRADMHDIHKTTLSSADAIRAAERATGAPAIDAGLAKPLSADNAVLAYNIEVLKDGVPHRVAIDARTGQQIEDPEAVLSPWTPERLASEDEHHKS